MRIPAKSSIIRTIRDLLKKLIRNPFSYFLIEHTYKIIKSIHRIKKYDVDKYNIDPFQIYYVSPDSITRFSGRDRKDAYRMFGKIMDGDWDLIERRGGEYDHLTVGDRFEDTIFFKSLRQRFEEGADWTETPLIKELLSTSPHPGWPTCSTPCKILRKCQSLDRIFEDMKKRGAISALDLIIERVKLRNFLIVMQDEITVDIDRNGEMLFFNGQHRLAMAKILGLERIPVAVLVRHAACFDKKTAKIESEKLPVKEFV